MQNYAKEAPLQDWPHQLAWLLAFLGIATVALQCIDPIHSNDLWWHMVLGKHILETGNLIVDHSIFTWTYATPYLIYNAWVSEIILYLIYFKAGAVGLIALRYLVHGGFFALAAYFAIQRGVAYHPLTWTIIILGTSLSFIAKVIQPEMFTFAFMVLTVWLYFHIRAIGAAAWKWCYLFPILIAVWVNTHGAFVMSAFFFLSIGIGELLNIKFSPNLALPSKLRMHLFLALALCIPALLLNPFGYELPLYLLKSTLTFNSEFVDNTKVITGWDPTFKYNFPPLYALDYLLLSMAIFVFLIWQQIKNTRIDWVVIISFLLYSLFFVKTMRTTHFLAPIFVFASLDLLTHKEKSWAWPANWQTMAIIAACSTVIVGFTGWRTAQGHLCYPYYGSLWGSSTIDYKYPQEESTYILHHPEIKRLGNLYNDGGYLMYRLWPQVLITIDQRYFPFTSWINQYHSFAMGKEIQPFLDNNKADAWLIKHDNVMLIGWFGNSKNWVPLFIGSSGVLFGHASGTKPKIIIAPNITHTDTLTGLVEVFHTAIELREWKLAEQLGTQMRSLATGYFWGCPGKDYANVADGMEVALRASRAFYSGDYETTAKTLAKQIPFVYLYGIAVASNTILAQRAWVNNDYAHARTLAVAALKINISSSVGVYNTAIADWQYRKSVPTGQMQIKDDINWEFLVNVLLTHKEKIPKAYVTTIINTITAMRNKTLTVKPEFISFIEFFAD